MFSDCVVCSVEAIAAMNEEATFAIMNTLFKKSVIWYRSEWLIPIAVFFGQRQIT